MTSIWDILDETEFNLQLALKNIRVQTHPDFPELSIANYTEQCAFNRHWNDVTRMCRGLIWNSETGDVLARPFPKFFNLGEPEAPVLDPSTASYHWADKADGSLGILYNDPNGYPRIATRGSFASEQAVLGTQILHESGRAWQWAEYIDSGYTPLFEICGPDNRIVLRYDRNFLQPLGFISIETGQFVPPEGTHRSRTLASLLDDLERPNAEGWVLWTSSREAVKLKQEDYKALHRMVSNLNEKEVWRQLRSGMYDTYVKQLPDELFALADEWRFQLQDRFIAIHTQAHIDLMQLPISTMSKDAFVGTRKEQALWINANVPAATRGLVFGLLDGKEISDAIWRLLEPRGATIEGHGQPGSADQRQERIT